MSNTQTSNEPTNQIDEDPNKEAPAVEGEDEFKITVKKLEFAVKPRGVLAE